MGESWWRRSDAHVEELERVERVKTRQIELLSARQEKLLNLTRLGALLAHERTVDEVMDLVTRAGLEVSGASAVWVLLLERGVLRLAPSGLGVAAPDVTEIEAAELRARSEHFVVGDPRQVGRVAALGKPRAFAGAAEGLESFIPPCSREPSPRDTACCSPWRPTGPSWGRSWLSGPHRST